MYQISKLIPNIKTLKKRKQSANLISNRELCSSFAQKNIQSLFYLACSEMLTSSFLTFYFSLSKTHRLIRLQSRNRIVLIQYQLFHEGKPGTVLLGYSYCDQN